MTADGGTDAGAARTLASAYTVPDDAYDLVVERDVRIPTGEPGVTLSADIYRPATSDPVPALVTVSPYGKDYIAGSTYDAPARWFAAHGYASVIVDLLGTGASDGVRRREFDPADGDDAVAAIGWAAAAAWCNGSVGAWGMSYAANSTLRAASRRPTALRAIIAVAHTLDAGRHSVHPDGARGDLHALVNRGTSMLLQQILPPLVDYASPDAQARWLQRLHSTEPALLDYARLGPDDPVWSEAVIPGGEITVPTLLVGGWRDSFVEGLTDAYQRLGGPKRLVVGAWGHLLPHESAHGPVDFLGIALRWWNQWLRGEPAPPEPPVLLSLGENGWRAYDSWPPPATKHLFVAAADTLIARGPDPLVPRQGPRLAAPVGRYIPDATVGTLRGLPGLGLGESCPPQDQHDDDLRCLQVTSEALPSDLLVGGRPEVMLRLDTPVPRLVVRLCAVDDRGRSTLISAGVLRPGPGSLEHRMVLPPVHVDLPAGIRLRVAVSDADFPRLTPVAEPIPFTVLDLAVLLPVVPAAGGHPASMPSPRQPPPPRPNPVEWTISRDPARGRAGVEIGSDTGPVVSRDGHGYRVRALLSAVVRRDAPEAARCTGTHRAEVFLRTGEHITAVAAVRCTQDAVYAQARVAIDGFVICERRWHERLQREPSLHAGPGHDMGARTT
jgi:uncharacterized protein